MLVTVEALKAHLRIENDEEDELLESLIVQAQAHCEDFCMREFPDTQDDPAPDAVKLAVLLLAGHFYENRTNDEKQVWLSVEMALNRLLWPHRDPEKLF